MILVFGGTTEGRKAVEVLEEAGNVYYYSTKTGEQDITLHHGQRIDGALDEGAMRTFCQGHDIRMIVDAAHPFASKLHHTIASVAEALAIPVIRYERIYPPRDPDITWIDDYSQIPTDIHSLLATTGVQSIGKLKYLETKGIKVTYRILNRESSIQLAHQQGATDEQLCFYPQTAEADAVLMKESGESGGFSEKIAEARERGMRIIVLKRPEGFVVHGSWFVVNGPYGLRRAVEKLLPAFFPLHSGLTTGTCATAAAVAEALRLVKGDTPAEVPVLLPNGETISVPVRYADGYACCIKEAGDDPDVTDGIEIRATMKLVPTDGPGQSLSDTIEIVGGEGVGTFTLPGFDYPPGEPAINKAPREMIRQNLTQLINPLHSGRGRGWVCTISVPQGAEIARRTFNPRLGIEGGISIIGVSGIVMPFSEQAFKDSIRKCMQVAVASGTERVVIHSGAKSERFLRQYYTSLPAQAFVEYGNYIGDTIRMAAEQGVRQLTLGIMMGKAVKLAQGHLDTHSRRVTMDKVFISEMLRKAGISIDLTAMTLARELWTLVPQKHLQSMADIVIAYCRTHCEPLLPQGSLTILLLTDEGDIYTSSSIRTESV